MLFEEFCSGPFWNETLLVNKITSCFRDTALVWVPCGFLWFGSAVYMWCVISNSTLKPVPITWLNILKTTISCILVTLSLISAVLLWSSENTTWARNTGYVLKAVTYFLTIILIQLDRRYGVKSSGLLFVYWTTEVITSLLPLYTRFMLKTYGDNVVGFILSSISFGFILIQFVLHWFSDLPRQRGRTDSEQRQCPEITASFPSQLFMWWMTALIIQGYRKGVEEGDMWQLNPRDTSQTLVSKFEQEWKRLKRACVERK